MDDARTRLTGALMMIGAAVFGLASRQPPLQDWPIIGPWGGDAAWTMAACGGLRVLRPGWSPLRVAFAGYALSVAVEVSQLLDLWPLDDLRRTRVGGLLIGRGFLWSDLVAYGVGGLLYGGLDRAVIPPVRTNRVTTSGVSGTGQDPESRR